MAGAETPGRGRSSGPSAFAIDRLLVSGDGSAEAEAAAAGGDAGGRPGIDE